MLYFKSRPRTEEVTKTPLQYTTRALLGGLTAKICPTQRDRSYWGCFLVEDVASPNPKCW